MSTPSAADAARLYATYTTRGAQNNGGEQEVWANFHQSIHELPIGFNAHHGLKMADDEWRRVHVVHAISGHQINRLPAFLAPRVRIFSV